MKNLNKQAINKEASCLTKAVDSEAIYILYISTVKSYFFQFFFISNIIFFKKYVEEL